MLDGLADDEMNSFLDVHPTIIPLFKIDVLLAAEPYVANAIDHEASHELDPTSIKELQQACDTPNHKLAI
mgnify:CR=1 FL=1